MPHGKGWTKAETIALVALFVHLLEDTIIGVNQRVDTLYEHVVAEVKTRYAGDWCCGILVCKGCWLTVLKEVQKFIGTDLLVQSVPHSGWNEGDHYNAKVKAYFFVESQLQHGKHQG
jgi:hypothetical protein